MTAHRMTEAAWQDQVVRIAHLRGWRCAHFRRAPTTSGGHATPTAYDAAGFPDLVLAHPQHGVIFAELKTDTGRVTDQQREWGELLTQAGARHHTWRPRDLRAVSALLAGGDA